MYRKEAFDSWMKNIYRKENGEKFLSAEPYLKYMIYNADDLGMSEDKLYEINSKSYLEKLLIDLKQSRGYLNREEDQKKNHPAAFGLYLQFMDYQKVKNQ